MDRRSLRCVVRVAPQYCPEFQALCDSLQRNDPTVTTVTTDRSTTPEAYGRLLGEALLSNNNSVVSEINLNLSFLLCELERQGGTANSAKSLLAWIEQSSSLRTVTLHSRYGTLSGLYIPAPNDELLLQRAVNAMKSNPNIKVFHSYTCGFPLQLLTEYSSTPEVVSNLNSLKIYIPRSRSMQSDQAAQAIAALSGLKELSLACTIEFLKCLPVHLTMLLRELELEIGYDWSTDAANMAQLFSVLSCSKDLRHVTIKWLKLNDETWDHLRSGLQANPSITHLKLQSCYIVPDSCSVIVSHMQSRDMASLQNLRCLDLSSGEVMCLFRRADQGGHDDSPSRFAQMLCGSLLQHVTFDFHGVSEREVAEFFAVLSANSSAVRLLSMHLKGFILWDMSPYLSSNIHLRHLTFSFLHREGDNDEFVVPSTFLRSLRRNGSLYTVDFKNKHGQSYAPSDDVVRFIQACTTRNRELSHVMKSSFQATAARMDEANVSDVNNRDHDAEHATRKDRFPALCRVSQQAERTAPNAVLQGLLASSDVWDTTTSSHILGKRVAAEALEGS